LIATGLVLFIMTLGVNLIARIVIYRAAVRRGVAR
jgi:ABC-type phosphate transport system permease subunit